LQNVDLKFKVKPNFIDTTDTQLAQATILFQGDKYAAYLIAQALICCNAMNIFYNLDFVYPINIRDSSFSLINHRNITHDNHVYIRSFK
jgi:hypothetical protein